MADLTLRRGNKSSFDTNKNNFIDGTISFILDSQEMYITTQNGNVNEHKALIGNIHRFQCEMTKTQNQSTSTYYYGFTSNNNALINELIKSDVKITLLKVTQKNAEQTPIDDLVCGTCGGFEFSIENNYLKINSKNSFTDNSYPAALYAYITIEPLIIHNA